jgi:hypothetical protein
MKRLSLSFFAIAGCLLLVFAGFQLASAAEKTVKLTVPGCV